MLSIGTCRVCKTGPLGLRRCGVCRRVVLLCDECDTAWPSTAQLKKPTFATESDMPCPCCGASLLRNGSHWATREEAAGVDWIDQPNSLQEGSEFA